MKTLTFYKRGKPKFGVKTDHGIVDVESAIKTHIAPDKQRHYPTNVNELISGGDVAKQKLNQLLSTVEGNVTYLNEEELDIGPCVLGPQKIICVGLNYRKHAEESNMHIPQQPILFSKFNNTLTGHKQDVKLPARSSQVDYEAELAIVIGKTAQNVSKEEALSYVYGYCNANDLSARDLQMQTPQWLLGKTCDGFCPVGPYLVSRDEVDDPNNMRIRAVVNGEVRQDSNTSDMIFHCDDIISYCSHHMTLEPGDLILTGTPEGVILGYEEDKRVWLKDGDEVIIEIEKLGRLSNTMVR